MYVTFKNLTCMTVSSAKCPRLLAWRRQWPIWRYPMTARSCQNTRSKQSTGLSVPPTTLEHIRYTRPILPRQSMCPPTWTLHRKARLSNFSVRTGTYLHGVQPTCQVFLGNSPSTLSNYSPIRNQSSRQQGAYQDQSEPQSKQKSTGYSQQDSSEKSKSHNG